MEIARYAEKVSGVSDLELLDRHGKEVVEKTFNTDTELLDELVCHLKCPGDFETAALITTTEEEAFDLSRLLKLRGINVSYVDRNSSAFKKGLTVTTFYLAKGWNLTRFSHFAVQKKIRLKIRRNIFAQQELFTNSMFTKLLTAYQNNS